MAIVKREQEEAQKEREKEQEERRRKKRAKERMKRIMEAAFDGDTDEILTVLKEVFKHFKCCKVWQYFMCERRSSY